MRVKKNEKDLYSMLRAFVRNFYLYLKSLLLKVNNLYLQKFKFLKPLKNKKCSITESNLKDKHLDHMFGLLNVNLSFKFSFYSSPYFSYDCLKSFLDFQ